jgi:hypothetical protein
LVLYWRKAFDAPREGKMGVADEDEFALLKTFHLTEVVN